MSLKHISCGHARTLGEKLVRYYLMKHLKDENCVLLTSYNHSLKGGAQEHDLILINQHGVWLLEVKDWRGKIIIDLAHWKGENRYKAQNPIKKIDFKARAIHSALEKKGLGDISVVGMVVLSMADALLIVPRPPEVSEELAERLKKEARRVFKITTSSLIDAITVDANEYAFNRSCRKLTPELIERVAQILYPLHKDPGPQIIDTYKLKIYKLEHDLDLDEEESFIAYEATHVKYPNQRVRIKKYEIKNIATLLSEEDLKKAKQRFEQGMQALTKLAPHPNIVQPFDYRDDLDSDDIFWMVVERVKGKTLLERLHEGAISYEEQLHIVQGLVDALEYCHSNGVIHRNLKPSSIYITDDGTIKLDDFDNARILGMHTIISGTGRPLTVNRYTADEVIINAHDASEQSDLYSLGVIWYDMVMGTTTDPIMFSKLKDANIPAKAEELIRQLTAPKRADRLENATKVKEQLRGLCLRETR